MSEHELARLSVHGDVSEKRTPSMARLVLYRTAGNSEDASSYLKLESGSSAAQENRAPVSRLERALDVLSLAAKVSERLPRRGSHT